MTKKIEVDSLFDISKKCLNSFVNPSDKDEIPTGYYQLDRVLGSLRPGNLITLGGLTSMGKSAFALNLLRNVSVNYEIPTLLFSAEMKSEDILKRLISIHCEIPYRKIDRAKLSEEEWKKLDAMSGDLNAPLYIENTHHLYIEDIERVAKEAVELYGIKLIVVDYLQMMYYKVKMNDSRYVEINSIICHLKSLAIELQVPIIVVSQLNRNIESRDNGGWNCDDKIPQLSDLRDSGTIGDDSDVVMFIHRPEYFHIFQDEQGNDLRGITKLIIAKNRNGFKGTGTFHFNEECLLFRDIDEIIKEESNLNNDSQDSPFEKSFGGGAPF